MYSLGMSDEIVNPVKRAKRRYFIEFGLSMLAYLGVLWFRNWLLSGPPQSALPDKWQIAIALLPVIPVAFVLAAIVRLVRRTDEFYRRITVDSLAIAGGATAFLAATYGFIEGGTFPHLSAWWTYSTFMVAWLIASFFVRRQYR
jgi:hypothetical protein